MNPRQRFESKVSAQTAVLDNWKKQVDCLSEMLQQEFGNARTAHETGTDLMLRFRVSGGRYVKDFKVSAYEFVVGGEWHLADFVLQDNNRFLVELPTHVNSDILVKPSKNESETPGLTDEEVLDFVADYFPIL